MCWKNKSTKNCGINVLQAMAGKNGFNFLRKRRQQSLQDMTVKTKKASTDYASADPVVIDCRLVGIAPILFDRYAGDNKTELPVAEKMYLDDAGHLTIPTINIYSLLCAENTKSVTRQFFGKNAKTTAMGISAFVTIEPFDALVLHDDNGPIVFSGFNEQILVDKRVARLPKGIPNPKVRPRLNLPWYLECTVTWTPNNLCTLENLRQAFVMGGVIGVGTYRHAFGRYRVDRFEVRS